MQSFLKDFVFAWIFFSHRAPPPLCKFPPVLTIPLFQILGGGIHFWRWGQRPLAPPLNTTSANLGGQDGAGRRADAQIQDGTQI